MESYSSSQIKDSKWTKNANKLHNFINKTTLCQYPFIMRVEYTENIQRIYRDYLIVFSYILLQRGTIKVIDINLHV